MKATSDLLTRYEREIEGVLGCFDRLVVSGTLTEVGHPAAMEAVLYREGIRCFDIGQFAEPLRERIRDNTLEQACAAGVEYLSRSKLPFLRALINMGGISPTGCLLSHENSFHPLRGCLFPFARPTPHKSTSLWQRVKGIKLKG